MKSTYQYILLAVAAFSFSTLADAQTKPVKKTTTKKVVAKPGAKTATNAKKLGDAVAKTTPQDTVKKGGQGQPTQNTGGSLSEEIVVTNAYKPVLADAVKIRRNPDLEDVSPFKAPLTYSLVDKRLERNTDIRQLEAMKMPAEQDSILKNNYVKVGLGSLKTTFGEAYVNNGRDDALQAGAWVKHFAQSGNINKQAESRDEVGLFGKSVGDVNTLSGRIKYNRRGNNFYGFNEFTTIEQPVGIVNKQHFNTLEAEGEIAKNYKDVERDFTYALKLNASTFGNAYKARENALLLTGFINQTVRQFYAGLSASLDLSTQKDSLFDINNSIARVNPYLKFQGDNYKIDAGVNVVSEFGASSRFFVFPAAKVEVQVVPKYVRLFVEAKGDVNRSSIRGFTEINPFLGKNYSIQNSVDALDVSAGLKGTLAPGLGFKASVFRNSVKNMPLFVSGYNTLNDNNRFSVIYDGGRARINGFNGELDYKTSDDLNIFGRVEFRDYSMATEEQAWNLPKFKLTAGTVIHISNKVNINGSLVFRGETKDRISVIGAGGVANPPQIVTLKAFADLSGGVEYKVNNRFSVFGQVNNLLSAKYQQWLYYPNYGFNIFGGVGFGF